MTAVAKSERALATIDELIEALGCRSVDGLERLLCHSHDLDVVIEECRGGGDPAGCVRLRAADCGLRIDFPVTLDSFWDEVDQLEACAREDVVA